MCSLCCSSATGFSKCSWMIIRTHLWHFKGQASWDLLSFNSDFCTEPQHLINTPNNSLHPQQSGVSMRVCATAITSVILIDIITPYESFPSSRFSPRRSGVNISRVAVLTHRPAIRTGRVWKSSEVLNVMTRCGRCCPQFQTIDHTYSHH